MSQRKVFNMKKSEIEKLIKEMVESGNEEWNHQYIFPNNIRTRRLDVDSPGYNTNKWKRLKPIIETIDPNKKSFLDIGCSDGFYSVEIAKIGAQSVLGTDLDELRIKRAKFAKKILEIKNVEFEVLDLYDTPDKEKYDVVMGLGLLHRIPDMDRCIKKMCEIGSTVLVEFKTLRSGADIAISHGGKSKSNSLNKLHKTPSIIYVKNRFIELGYDNIVVYEDKLSHLNYPRTIIVASKKDA
mgnify:CR=1 FL=1